MGKKGKKYPAHQIARKNFFEDQKAPMSHPPAPRLRQEAHGRALTCHAVRTATSSWDSILDMTSEY